MAPRRRSAGQPAAEPEARHDAVSDADSSDWEIDHNGERDEQPDRHQRPRPPQRPLLTKDAEEEELERLVLGDRAGFRAQLFGDEDETGADALGEVSLARMGEDEDEDDSSIEDMDDANMFLYDEAMETLEAAPTTKSPDAATAEDAPAWVDSDDERLVVSLAGQSRLRKLRLTVDEDRVNGTVYAARLRQQYIRLHGQPAWAAEAEAARRERIRRQEEKDDGDDGDDSSTDEDGNNDNGLFVDAATPLDSFFRSTRAMAGASQLLFEDKAGGSGGRARRRRLLPEMIDIQKTRDIPTPHSGPVRVLAFHPAFNVLLSASRSVLHLHQIAPAAHPTPNPLLTAVRVRRMLAGAAGFLYRSIPGQAGKEEKETSVVFTGGRPYFGTWDLASGRVQRVPGPTAHAYEHRVIAHFRLSPRGTHMAVVPSERLHSGKVNVVDTTTWMWVAQADLGGNTGIADLQWWRDGSGLTLLGGDGQVGEWRLATRRFVGKWRDEGSTAGTVLALGGGDGPAALGGDRWAAVGSRSGITNLYDRWSLVKEADKAAAALPMNDDDDDDDRDVPRPRLRLVDGPSPLRVLQQLVTPVTAIAFTPDGQLMAFASSHKRDALRLVHLPSATVYRNWPTAATPFGQVSALAFSTDGDMLAVGNKAGKTRLWEIRA